MDDQELRDARAREDALLRLLTSVQAFALFESEPGRDHAAALREIATALRDGRSPGIKRR